MIYALLFSLCLTGVQPVQISEIENDTVVVATVNDIDEVPEETSDDSSAFAVEGSATLDDVVEAINNQTDIINSIVDAKIIVIDGFSALSTTVVSSYYPTSSGWRYNNGARVYFRSIPLIANYTYEFTSLPPVNGSFYAPNIVVSSEPLIDNVSEYTHLFDSFNEPFTFTPTENCYITFSNTGSLQENFSLPYSYSKYETYSMSDVGSILEKQTSDYEKVNERNLTEALPEDQPMLVNKYEDNLYKVLVAICCSNILLVGLTLVSIFIRRSERHG